MSMPLQWLIDLIVSLIPGGPGYVDRGDAATFDFTAADLTIDDDWHDLDLSTVIPSGSTAVHLRHFVQSNNISARIRFRKKGHTGFANIADSQIQASTRPFPDDKIIGLDEDRFIQYRVFNTMYTNIFITVAGWFGPES